MYSISIPSIPFRIRCRINFYVDDGWTYDMKCRCRIDFHEMKDRHMTRCRIDFHEMKDRHVSWKKVY